MRSQFVSLVRSLEKRQVFVTGVVSEGWFDSLVHGGSFYYEWRFLDRRGVKCFKRINLCKLFRACKFNIGLTRSKLRSKLLLSTAMALKKNVVLFVNSQRSFSRKSMAAQQAISRIRRSVSYWLDQHYDEWSADPGYQLFFPEVFFLKEPCLSKFDDLRLWGAAFRFGTDAELEGDHFLLAEESTFFARFRNRDKSLRTSFQTNIVRERWNMYLDIMVENFPALFPRLKTLTGKRISKTRFNKIHYIDPLGNDDVMCLFTNLKWPLVTITGDWKLAIPNHRWPALKPRNSVACNDSWYNYYELPE